MKDGTEDDRRSQVLLVATLFITMTWIALLLRVYVRVRMIKSWGLDDWLMVAAQLIFSVYIACQIAGVHYGTGRHMWDLAASDASKALEIWYFCEISYVLCTSVLKIAIGHFFLRIAVERAHIRIIHIVNLCSGLGGSAYLFLLMFQCLPIRDFWQWPPQAHNGCINPKIVTDCTYAASAFVALIDITYAVLPAFMIGRLNMSRKTKVVAGGILAFAGVGVAATLVRFKTVQSLSDVDDFLWATTSLARWSTIEPGIGITAACMATYRPLFQRLRHHLRSPSPFSPPPRDLEACAPAADPDADFLHNPAKYLRTRDLHAHPRPPDLVLEDRSLAATGAGEMGADAGGGGGAAAGVGVGLGLGLGSMEMKEGWGEDSGVEVEGEGGGEGGKEGKEGDVRVGAMEVEVPGQISGEGSRGTSTSTSCAAVALEQHPRE